MSEKFRSKLNRTTSSNNELAVKHSAALDSKKVPERKHSKLTTLQKDCAYLHCLSVFFCQLLALISMLLDGAAMQFFFY